MTEEQARDNLSVELGKAPEEQDQPLLKKLFRATLKTRRTSLSVLEDGAVAKLITEVPLLKSIDYVSHCIIVAKDKFCMQVLMYFIFKESILVTFDKDFRIDKVSGF